MASEIERLPDLTGFLKLASIPDWQAVTLTPMSEPAPVRKRSPSIVASPPSSVAAAFPTNSPASRTAVRKRTRQGKAAAHRAPAAPRETDHQE